MSDENDQETPDEQEETLFPTSSVEGDENVTPQNIIAPGSVTEVTVSLGRAEVPLYDGLLNPKKAGRLLVSYLPGKVEEVPKRDPNDPQALEWKIRQNLRATFIKSANDEAELIRQEFRNLLELDPARAGALVDEIQGLVSEVLAKA